MQGCATAVTMLEEHLGRVEARHPLCRDGSHAQHAWSVHM